MEDKARLPEASGADDTSYPFYAVSHGEARVYFSPFYEAIVYEPMI